MRPWYWVIIWICGMSLPAVATTTTLFTYRSAETELDTRNHYDIALLKLALEKTKPSYGDYQLVPSPPMNTSRAMQELVKGSYPNFIIKMSYSPDYEQSGMLRGSYELDLGVTGYRVCFTRQALLPELARQTTKADWQHYLYGLGTGWQDGPILRHNGFKVMEVASYKNLFPMVAKGRFDLFCRGINEIRDEWPEAKLHSGMALEPAMMLYYDLPRFFYANPHDSKGLQRVDEGLRLAAADGSLLTLWKQYYLPSVEYVQPRQRHLFSLSNPVVSQLKWADKQLVFDPLSGTFHYRQ